MKTSFLNMFYMTFDSDLELHAIRIEGNGDMNEHYFHAGIYTLYTNEAGGK